MSLSRDAIVDAAVAVLRRDGVEAMSMRAVASELGAGAGALYGHVSGKEELIELLIDRVMAEIELPDPDPARWREQLKEVARRQRRLLHEFGGIARLTLGRIPVGPQMIRVGEWQLGLLRGAGLPDRTVAYAGDLLSQYVEAFAYEESLVTDNEGGRRPIHETVAMLRQYIASLPPERFPHLTSLSDEMTGGGPDARFEFGLDVLIRGLAETAG
ncbi:MAG: TetR/AcrR family transcriptional regulator [Thermoleophilia bacterium]